MYIVHVFAHVQYIYKQYIYTCTVFKFIFCDLATVIIYSLILIDVYNTCIIGECLRQQCSNYYLLNCYIIAFIYIYISNISICLATLHI